MEKTQGIIRDELSRLVSRYDVIGYGRNCSCYIGYWPESMKRTNESHLVREISSCA